jgi:urease accessory protein
LNTEVLVGLLQFTDGLFPAGGHAHSFGLETYVQDERVVTRDDVRVFVESLLAGSAGPCDAVAAVVAARAGRASDLAGLLTTDARLDAQKPARELREASRQMGRQTLRTALALIEQPALRDFGQEVSAGRTPSHHAVVFGLVGQALRTADEAVAAAFLYQTAVVVVNASLRLLSLGQVDGQKVLWSVRPLVARLAREAVVAGDPAAMWSFNPGIDVASMRHEGLPARLFRS